MFGLVLKSTLKEADEKLREKSIEAEVLRKINQTLQGEAEFLQKMLDLRGETVAAQETLIGRQNVGIRAMETERGILSEIVVSSIEIMKEYTPITSEYHVLIFSGEATVDDMKKCSEIMQRILKMRKEFHELVQLYYNKEKKVTLGMNLNMSILKS